MYFSNNDFTVEYYDVLSSTNDFVRKNLFHGRVVVAGYQTAGRGQRERTWVAKPESSLLATVVLDISNTEGINSEKLSLGTAKAIIHAISLFGLCPKLKLPNDIMVDGKKICGILIEVVNGFAIIGFGINVNDHPENFNATSIEAEVKSKSTKIIKTDLLNNILIALPQYLR